MLTDGRVKTVEYPELRQMLTIGFFESYQVAFKSYLNTELKNIFRNDGDPNDDDDQSDDGELAVSSTKHISLVMFCCSANIFTGTFSPRATVNTPLAAPPTNSRATRF